jgi:hypothetical protein
MVDHLKKRGWNNYGLCPFLQANPRDNGAPLLSLHLLQEALRNGQALAWCIFYPNPRVDDKPLYQGLVVHVLGFKAENKFFPTNLSP